MYEVPKVVLPNYYLTDLLNKDKLLEIIKNDTDMNRYIPDCGYLESIERDFLLGVSYN